MKRLHPEVNQIYENIKLLKHKTTKPAVPKQQPIDNKDAHQFLNSTAFLENMPIDEAMFGNNSTNVSVQNETEDGHVSETTDNSNGNSPGINANMELNVDKQTPVSQLEDTSESDIDESAQSTTTTTTSKIDLQHESVNLISNMLDQKLSRFVTRSEMKQLTRKLAGVSNPSVNIETNNNDAAIQAQLKALENQCRELQAVVLKNQRSKFKLQRELHGLERSMQEGKLIVHNLKVVKTQEPQNAIEQLFAETLQLTDLKFSKVSSMGKSNFSQDKQQILVELSNPKEVGLIFKNCHKLKHSGVFIEPQMSVYARKRNGKLLVLRREILKRQQQTTTLQIQVRNGQLIVNGQKFFWDEVDGLCLENAGESIATDNAASFNLQTKAVDSLKTLTGLDLTEFLNVLKNYDVQFRIF